MFSGVKGRSLRLACAAIAGSLVGHVGARAQVLEIGDDGAVTLYDRPTVFESGAARPISVDAPAALPPVPTAAVGLHPAYAALNGAARLTELSPELIEAVAWRESRLRPGVVSSAGAIGEMQLMPGTARALGVDPYDTVQNFRGGARYLADMLRRYDGDLVLALAAYNAGPGAVDRYGGVPPYRETRAYVTAILDRLSQRATQAGLGQGR
jgi:soluble lytic murein transglycosylase-like protein